jgi:hypothetical protein
METAVQTLSQFLLARIAEDESAAEFHHDQTCGLVTHPDWSGCDCARAESKRVLAECEAKRQIVKRLESLLAEHFSVSAGERHRQEAQHPHLRDWRHMRETRMLELERTLGDLAAVYADHPDYREEWRP